MRTNHRVRLITGIFGTTINWRRIMQKNVRIERMHSVERTISHSSLVSTHNKHSMHAMPWNGDKHHYQHYVCFCMHNFSFTNIFSAIRTLGKLHILPLRRYIPIIYYYFIFYPSIYFAEWNLFNLAFIIIYLIFIHTYRIVKTCVSISVSFLSNLFSLSITFNAWNNLCTHCRDYSWFVHILRMLFSATIRTGNPIRTNATKIISLLFWNVKFGKYLYMGTLKV